MSESQEYQVCVISHPDSGRVFGTSTTPFNLDVYEEATIVNGQVNYTMQTRMSELGIEVDSETGASSVRVPKVEFKKFDTFDEAKIFAMAALIATMSQVEQNGINQSLSDQLLDSIDEALDG